jgi:tripartite-type tricarboxylate transporter receptor subunit TctC
LKRRLLALAAALLPIISLGQVAAVDSSVPLVILVGGPAGTPGDLVARAIAGPLAAELGQPVVVENRPGAAGTIALGAVARARADGQVLGVMGLQSAVAPSLVKSMPYDTAKGLVPVRQLSSVSNVLIVRADSPWTTLEQMLTAARADRLSYASGGNATPAHLAAELFRQEAGVQLQHVPFGGAVAGVSAVLGGHVQMMFATTPSVLPLIKSGKVRALATAAQQRLPSLPDIPTFAESGLRAVALRDWHGIVAPAGTSPQRIEQLASALARALRAEHVLQRLAGAGLEPATESDPRAFGALIDMEIARWAAIVGKAGITLQ